MESQGFLLLLFSHSIMPNSLQPYRLQHISFPYTSPPRACSNSSPLSHWGHPTSSSSVIPFSSCIQCFPASGSFLMHQLFASGGQHIGASASASASVLPMNIQDWFPLGLTGLISLLFKGLSKVFFNTTVQKHQFFGSQPSLWSNSLIHTWLFVGPLMDWNLVVRSQQWSQRLESERRKEANIPWVMQLAFALQGISQK